ncbi:MAG: hypothetical protein J2P33_03840, partial [Actinobacteria bacterium]|nr:hypothetical protein [Actinomycetota bacterium]
MAVVGDGEILDAIAAGDPAGLTIAYDRHAAELYGFCRVMLADPGDAAEALQDTFAAADSGLRALRDPGHLRPWLFAMARGECHRRLSERAAPGGTGDAPGRTGAAGDAQGETGTAGDAQGGTPAVVDASAWTGAADSAQAGTAAARDAQGETGAPGGAQAATAAARDAQGETGAPGGAQAATAAACDAQGETGAPGGARAPT